MEIFGNLEFDLNTIKLIEIVPSNKSKILLVMEWKITLEMRSLEEFSQIHIKLSK